MLPGNRDVAYVSNELDYIFMIKTFKKHFESKYKKYMYSDYNYRPTLVQMQTHLNRNHSLSIFYLITYTIETI